MKLYKKTLIVCSIIFLCCTLLSTLFLLPCFSRLEIIIFLRDYMVGVACSIIVVLVTTYLQFRFEQSKTLASVLSGLRFFFFDYLCIAMALDPNEQIPKKLWNYYYEKMEKQVKELTTELLRIEWFSKKKTKLAMEIQKQFLTLRIDLSRTQKREKDEILKEIVGASLIEEIKNSSLLLAQDDVYTHIREEIIKDYEKAEKCLSEYKFKI